MKTIEEKLKVLSKIAESFNKSQIHWAVGGSLLLYLKGYTEHFNDIDLLIYNDDAGQAKELMRELGPMRVLDRNCYRAEHFYIFDVDEVEVDIMGDYYVMKEGVEHKVALGRDADIEWMHLGSQMVPLDSIPMWRRHYDVMGRKNKVDMIDRRGL
jgi:hypothetical protein